jgi:hypothetical protein
MANAYFNVDYGITVGSAANVTIEATSGNITTTGNITINSTTLAYTANSVTPKSYVDNIAVVFGI